MSKPQIFISHSHKDIEWVREFAKALEKQDINVWLDEWQIAAGESIRDALESGLRKSDAIVTILSRNNMANSNVFFELGVAIGMNKRIIPIVSQDVDSNMIPFDLRLRRFLKQRSPGETAQEVAIAVKEIEKIREAK